MQTYEELHERFPSKKLVRKILNSDPRSIRMNIQDAMDSIHAALLTILEHSTLNERVHLTYRGKCILHPYLDDSGKERQITFQNKERQRYVTRKLAKQLRLLVRDGIDVKGQGSIVLQNGDVVYVPKPLVPKYGNILFFTPRKTF